jgi:hypothetical protein
MQQQQQAIDKGVNYESWSSAGLTNTIYNFYAIANGTDSAKLNEDGTITYQPGGLMSSTSNIIASAFTPMASGVEYVAQIKNNFLGKPVYAANQTGFEGLSSIMNLWKMSRNIVYVLISLVFIGIGIMIMLRIKISPQATVTIQSSIPKIISTLILVTFSYAIAGFCIDLINLIQAFAISLLFNGLGKNLTDNLFPLGWSNISIQRLIEIIKQSFGTNAYSFSNLNNLNLWGVMSLVQRLAPNFIILLLGGVIGGIMGAGVGASAGPVGVATGAAAGGAVGGLLIGLIITIVIFIYLIKFGFGLAKCYLVTLIKIIFAPFEILLGAFPNSKNGFSSWLIGVVANLAVFPVSVLFLIVANLLIDSVGGVGTGLWAPTLVQGPYVWFLPLMIGLAAIAMLSKLPTLIPEAIFQIKPSPFGKAIGEGFSESTKKIKSSDYYRQGMSHIGHEMSEKGKVPSNNWDKFVGWTGRRINEKYTKK